MSKRLFILLILCATVAAQTSPSTQPKKPATSTTAKPAAAQAHKPGTAARPKAAAKPMQLTTDKQKASYAIGMNMGASMRKDGADIDPDALSQGLKDALAGNKTLLTQDEAQQTLGKFQTEMQAKMQEKHMQEATANKTAGEAFLAANKAKPGVVTLPSGLQYKVLTEGNGPKPTINDSVVCNYRGTLIDGSEFDSSYKRGQPATFPVGRVIKGWTEALQLMPTGSKWQLFIPSDLAYGERGAGNDIPPNSTLIFEVELIKIVSQ